MFYLKNWFIWKNGVFPIILISVVSGQLKNILISSDLMYSIECELLQIFLSHINVKSKVIGMNGT